MASAYTAYTVLMNRSGQVCATALVWHHTCALRSSRTGWVTVKNLPALGLTCVREIRRQRGEWMTLLLRPKMWWEGAETKCMRAAASWDASLERQGGGEDSPWLHVFIPLVRGSTDLSAGFSVTVSRRRSPSGLVASRSLGHRTACRPSNVRKRALFPHRPVWTRSFRWDFSVSG